MPMRDGCAAGSRTAGESANGTASRARRWILFEHPGAWGRDVLSDGTLPDHLGARLRELAVQVPARVLLIRRPPAEARPAGPARTLLVGHSTPSGGWLERLELTTGDELAALDLTPLRRGASVGGAPVTEPTYLVCTNGKHDACCAEYGRPLVDALTPRVGRRLWECSHVGGDRFAGNLVCLPDGLFYGHLDAADADGVVATHEAGRLDLDRWRGRSSLPFDVQAAEPLVRRGRGWDRHDDLRWLATDRAEDHVRVTFRRPDGTRVLATVRTTAASVPRQLTCAGRPSRPPVHELVALDVG